MKSKRFLSIILVFVMVFAMAVTTCGKKEEAAEKEEPKQEEASEKEDKQDDDQTEVKEEESSEAESDAGLTDEKIAELYSVIKSAVKSGYLEPNNISPSEFQWPVCKEEADGTFKLDEDFLWTYFITIYSNYTAIGKLFDTTDYPPGAPIPEEKELMDAVLLGISEWHEENSSIGFYEIDQKIGYLPIAISENVKFDE